MKWITHQFWEKRSVFTPAMHPSESNIRPYRHSSPALSLSLKLHVHDRTESPARDTLAGWTVSQSRSKHASDPDTKRPLAFHRAETHHHPRRQNVELQDQRPASSTAASGYWHNRISSPSSPPLVLCFPTHSFYLSSAARTRLHANTGLGSTTVKRVERVVKDLEVWVVGS